MKRVPTKVLRSKKPVTSRCLCGERIRDRAYFEERRRHGSPARLRGRYSRLHGTSSPTGPASPSSGPQKAVSQGQLTRPNDDDFSLGHSPRGWPAGSIQNWIKRAAPGQAPQDSLSFHLDDEEWEDLPDFSQSRLPLEESVPVARRSSSPEASLHHGRAVGELRRDQGLGRDWQENKAEDEEVLLFWRGSVWAERSS